MSSKENKALAALALKIADLKKKRKAKVKKIKGLEEAIEKVMDKRSETLKFDHVFAGSQGNTYQILPWGVDSDLDRGNVCGDLLPINQLDNILRMDPESPSPPSDSFRSGNEIFLKHLRVHIRIKAPEFIPAVTPATTAINKQGPSTVAKIRILTVFDNSGEQSLPLATSTSGVLGNMYDNIDHCTAAHRYLPTFKQYRSDKRFKVLSQKIITLKSTVPYVDQDFSVKINKKVSYVPSQNSCLQGVYIFAMSDYPATTTSHTQNGPIIEDFWVRYYYSDQ